MYRRSSPVCTYNIPRLDNLTVFKNGIRNIGIFGIRNQVYQLDGAVDLDTLFLYAILEYPFDDGLGTK